jgi:hypothetical protein
MRANPTASTFSFFLPRFFLTLVGVAKGFSPD